MGFPSTAHPPVDLLDRSDTSGRVEDGAEVGCRHRHFRLNRHGDEVPACIKTNFCSMGLPEMNRWDTSPRDSDGTGVVAGSIRSAIGVNHQGGGVSNREQRLKVGCPQGTQRHRPVPLIDRWNEYGKWRTDLAGLFITCTYDDERLRSRCRAKAVDYSVGGVRRGYRKRRTCGHGVVTPGVAVKDIAGLHVEHIRSARSQSGNRDRVDSPARGDAERLGDHLSRGASNLRPPDHPGNRILGCPEDGER